MPTLVSSTQYWLYPLPSPTWFLLCDSSLSLHLKKFCTLTTLLISGPEGSISSSSHWSTFWNISLLNDLLLSRRSEVHSILLLLNLTTPLLLPPPSPAVITAVVSWFSFYLSDKTYQARCPSRPGAWFSPFHPLHALLLSQSNMAAMLMMFNFTSAQKLLLHSFTPSLLPPSPTSVT